MRTIKKILVFIGIFIAIKVIFFIASDASRIQSEHDVESSSGGQAQEQPTAANSASAALASPTESAADDDTPKAGYHRYGVGQGVSLELPESWSLLSHSQVMAIKKKTGAVDDHPTTTPIAAMASSDASLNEAMFRASISDDYVSPDDIKNASRQDLDALCQSIGKTMSAALAKQGMAVTKAPYCYVIPVANKTALTASYQRTDAHGNGTWEVFIYQIPAKGKMAIFTTSYKTNSKPAVQLQLVDIMNSVQWN
ncbi:hypothetical protein LVQ78_03560 [Buttiauxella sp. A2-C2_NF]|uniref:hypothetical protein n=1 Tax=Buttiauxella ferragutiae TaxID=82989 RepID=UPI001E4C06C1|nr:hypothetical protein [Buttiauxella ferragutiae]MCE0825120.1 hypothetical protein [Buttiauxella ferragutiae]